MVSRIGSNVLKVIGKTLTTPRIWLIAAAVCLCAWIGLGYHQDQVAAQLALESKTGVAPDRSIAGPDLSEWRQIALAMACCLGLGGTLLQFRSSAGNNRRSARPTSEAAVRENAPAGFQPILTQEEIIGHSSEEAVEKDWRTSPSSKVTAFMQSAVQSLKPIKNRQ